MTIKQFILAKFSEFNLDYEYSDKDIQSGRNIVYTFICDAMRGRYGKDGTIYHLNLGDLEHALITLTVVDLYFEPYSKKFYIDCDYDDKENMIVLKTKKVCY